jgi:antitoxin CptB
MTETREIRIKRLRMRSMRRGIKEMDVILPAFADVSLAGMNDTDLNTYEVMLEENDHDLYQWVTRQTAVPDQFAEMITLIIENIERS